jgi:hypothetical protein
MDVAMKLSEMMAVIGDKISQAYIVVADVVSHSSIYQSVFGTTPTAVADTVYRPPQSFSATVTNATHYLRTKSATFDNVAKAYEESYDFRTVFYQASLSNLVKYALPVMAYESYVRPTYLDDSPYEMMDYPIKFVFCCTYLAMFVNNVAYNPSVAKTLTRFVPPPDKKHACKCIETTRIAASFSNIFHTLGNIATASALYWAPKGVDYIFGTRFEAAGAYMSFMVGSLAYGYCLVAMKYAHHGICAKHMRGLVNNNKIYCFLVGASFLGMTQGGSYVLNSLAGAKNNTFIDDAVFSHLYQFFIVFNMLKAGTLKADKKALELFYFQRLLVDKMLRYRSNKWVQALQPQEAKPSYMQMLSRHLNVTLMRKVFGNKMVQTLPQQKVQQSYTQKVNGYLDMSVVRYVASTTAISLLLSTHRDEIRSAVDTIIEKRGYPLWMLDYFPQYLTPDSIRILTDVLKQQGWEDTQILIAKVIAIALKERARVDAAINLMAAVTTASDDNYIARPAETETKLRSAIVAIENYTPQEFEAGLRQMIRRSQEEVHREQKVLADARLVEIERKVEKGVFLRKSVRRHSWGEGGERGQPTLFAVAVPIPVKNSVPSATSNQHSTAVPLMTSDLSLGSVQEPPSDEEYEILAEDTPENRVREVMGLEVRGELTSSKPFSRTQSFSRR